MKLDQFLYMLSDLAKEHDMKLVVIRNHEMLPNKNTGNDIDLIVKENDVTQWIEILQSISNSEGLEFNIIRKSYYCHQTVIIGVDDKNNRLLLDLNYRFIWRGVNFYKTEYLIDFATPYNECIWTVEPSIAWYITFCHSFLYGGFINKKYLPNYQAVLSDNDYSRIFILLLEDLLGKYYSNFIVKKLITADVALPRVTANCIRLFVLSRYMLRQPITTLRGFVTSFVRYS